MTLVGRAVQLLACCAGASGCWHEDALVDGTFTRDEWQFLETEFQLPALNLCPDGFRGTDCEALAGFGQHLFFEPALSGAITIDDPAAPGALGESGKVACASCHDSRDTNKPTDPRKHAFYIDTRSQPSNVSSGAIFTKHNAMSVVNTAYKLAVAEANCAQPDADPMLCGEVFSWTGAYPDPAGVLNLAGTNAMKSNGKIMARALCENGSYAVGYMLLFGTYPAPVFPSGPNDPPVPVHFCQGGQHDDATVFTNVGLALDAYTRRLTSVDSKFDRYVNGGLEPDRLTPKAPLADNEKRGLALFVGRAMCIECHRGPLLSDLEFHNTGVAQFGAHVPQVDGGLGVEPLQGKPEQHLGKWLTPPLRHVAETAPYMHSGQHATLAQAIEFYRRGGDPAGFSGIKDPRIQPLEIDDDEARDLEAFLRTLTGQLIPVELTSDPRPTP